MLDFRQLDASCQSVQSLQEENESRQCPDYQAYGVRYLCFPSILEDSELTFTIRHMLDGILAFQVGSHLLNQPPRALRRLVDRDKLV